MFISNVDNLGATVDLSVVYHFVNSDAEFCMEVTDKTRADVKGGTLVKYVDKDDEQHSGNCVRLLEAAQVPPKHIEEFTDAKVFSLFNTNNLWVKLRATQRLVQTGAIQSEVIEQRCTLSDGTNALQLETVAGAAIRFFEKAFGMKVPRARFLPVKTTSDLFLIQSNLFTARHGSLTVSPRRQFSMMPIVKLGPNFKNLTEYVKRVHVVRDCFPDILELDHLTVSGDVTFGKNVTLKGAVIIVAEDGHRIDIAEGSVLENNVITGHLRIMDH
jgi:UTP--glucose-1-phosphate uridylyltransferase